MEYTLNPFTRFEKDWALVTAGTKEKFNSCTLGWGTVGTIWGKDVICIYVRPERYTWSFLQESDYFTLSFFDDTHKKQLGVMGTLSGRDVDKVKETGLTPKFLENSITYEEAEEVFVCKKIFTQKLDKENFPEFAMRYYGEEGLPHYMFIGEVVERHVK